MKHLPFNPTPITSLPDYYSKLGGVILTSKRDDLFTEAMGGNKARILQYVLADISADNCDVLVTAGGPSSNYNRACALMCAKLGVPMHLIEYTDNPEEFKTSLNYYICNLVGIRKTRCKKTEVPKTIDAVLSDYQEKGIRVKFVYGGGKSVEGILAYFDAVTELSRQVETIDHLFVACGTGTTLTGICAGMQKHFPKATIHAISVARSYEVEQPVLTENMRTFNEKFGTNYNFSRLSFYDSYLCGGYAKTTPALLHCVKECITNEGMIIDPCYSGKAFYGMTQIINSNRSQYKGKNVLFWNTGGMINLLGMRNEYNL